MIAFQPAIELPSNMKPSVSLSSSITPEAMVRCCHLPLGSVKRRSTQSISSSLIRERIVPASFAILSFPISNRGARTGRAPAVTGQQRRDSSLLTCDSRPAPRSQEGGEDFTRMSAERSREPVSLVNHSSRRAASRRVAMRSILLWLIGIPIPIILLLAVCTHHF